MSMDSIDDLEAAEDELGEWRALVSAALAGDGNGQRSLRADQRQRLVKLASAPYCRPTCDTDGEPHEHTEIGVTPGYADGCGCPCHAQ